MRGTSFGNYEFKAIDNGVDPFYGILLLNFNGDHLALRSSFFAPGAFFNLRAAFPFYEIDVKQRLIRYRTREHEAWTAYPPKTGTSRPFLQLFRRVGDHIAKRVSCTLGASVSPPISRCDCDSSATRPHAQTSATGVLP